MQTHTLKKRIFGIMGLTVVALLFMCAPDAYALIDTSIDTKFVPLTNIPYMNQLNSASNFGEYVNAIYKVIIILGALVGVLRIAWAGVRYAMTDIVPAKGEALSDIRGVLFGLIILLIPFIVLNTIYSGLTNLDVFNGKGLGVDLSGRTSVQQPTQSQPSPDHKQPQVLNTTLTEEELKRQCDAEDKVAPSGMSYTWYPGEGCLFCEGYIWGTCTMRTYQTGGTPNQAAKIINNTVRENECIEAKKRDPAYKWYPDRGCCKRDGVNYACSK